MMSRGNHRVSVVDQVKPGDEPEVPGVAGDERGLILEGRSGDEEVHGRDRGSGAPELAQEPPIRRREVLAGVGHAKTGAQLSHRTSLLPRIPGQLSAGVELAGDVQGDRELFFRQPIPQKPGGWTRFPLPSFPEKVDEERCVQVDQSSGALAG